MTAQRVPAVEGWFTLDDEPQLIAQRCSSCGALVFPRSAIACPNPDCDGTEFDHAPLSRRGKVWSYTTNHYAPPAPYIAPDPFVPYTVVAVELEGDGMVVLGQLVEEADPSDLHVGDEVELTVGTLFTDGEGTDHVVWKWRPVAGEVAP